MPKLAKILLTSFVMGFLGLVFIDRVNMWRGIAALMFWLPIPITLALLANMLSNMTYKSFRDLD